MSTLDRLTRWFRLRHVPLHAPDVSRLDLLDGLPRGARPEVDSDDLARAITTGRPTTLRQVIDDALVDVDPPCMQPMTVPPFEECGSPADPDHPEQLCEEHANRRRS